MADPKILIGKWVENFISIVQKTIDNGDDGHESLRGEDGYQYLLELYIQIITDIDGEAAADSFQKAVPTTYQSFLDKFPTPHTFLFGGQAPQGSSSARNTQAGDANPARNKPTDANPETGKGPTR